MGKFNNITEQEVIITRNNDHWLYLSRHRQKHGGEWWKLHNKWREYI